MVATSRFNTHSRVCLSLGLYLLFVFIVADTRAQTVTYHLHREASTTANLFQLRTNGPDAASFAIQSANLKNKPAGEYLIKAFDTQNGVPGATGTITAGSTVTFSLWLKRTGSGGTMFPRAKLNLNAASGTTIAVVTSATPLTTTLTKYTLSGTVPANLSMTSGDRLYLWVGVNLTAAPSQNSVAELDVEGALNGNFDSTITVPLPNPPPSISGLTPDSGTVGAYVNVAGTNFGATQGTSTITFNGTAATPTSWSATNIVAQVPPSATTGPVVVAAQGQASNEVTFTVTSSGTIAGTITRTSDGAAVSGALVEALQASVVNGSTTSAANGSYSLVNLPPGTYDVRIVVTGYQTRIQNGVVVTASNTTTVNQSLDVLSPNGDIEYVYDELGRLIATITSTETVRYAYDAVGNLLSISRGTASQVSIIEFTPNSGSIDTTVTIYGTAFSSVPSENTVRFNGVVAIVTSATATRIVTSVPAGASTGPISVTSPAGTATSSTPFVVGTPGAPTITGFDPTIGTVGASVTITGTNFEFSPYTSKTKFNKTLASMASATTTEIVTSVPSQAASGRISVETPLGLAVSSGDFFIVPAPRTPADIGMTGRIEHRVGLRAGASYNELTRLGYGGGIDYGISGRTSLGLSFMYYSEAADRLGDKFYDEEISPAAKQYLSREDIEIPEIFINYQIVLSLAFSLF
jgi:YD repeat-containing protein